jgi:hypothetical protein
MDPAEAEDDLTAVVVKIELVDLPIFFLYKTGTLKRRKR